MSSFFLTDHEKNILLEISRNQLKRLFDYNVEENYPVTDHLKDHCGAFVSLYNGNNLRGCIGAFRIEKPLYETVKDVTISSALNDYRFSPITSDEVDEITIEISVLTPLERIQSLNQIELGKHGIYIKKGMLSGTFLPQVALKTNWTVDEFVGHCSRDKAGIGWEGWRDAELYRYEAIVFNDKDIV
ncbi:MAG: AmmeMemoRadiSam system protein A [Prolixibacteraceae bacterium]|jgi:AmmeMemoRadiSam system protein A|nr:AmmeMemoRadiSam system protein A [Prolixibacteraceae bacterium]